MGSVSTKFFSKRTIVISLKGLDALPVKKRIESLIADGKFAKASVVLMNHAEEFPPAEFKSLNKEIKNNLPKCKSTEGDYPTSNGRRVCHGPRYGNGH